MSVAQWCHYTGEVSPGESQFKFYVNYVFLNFEYVGSDFVLASSGSAG